MKLRLVVNFPDKFPIQDVVYTMNRLADHIDDGKSAGIMKFEEGSVTWKLEDIPTD